MALYSFNISLVSRGKGQSIVAADAYICGEKLRDNYEGKLHDRSYRDDVLHKELLLPVGAPNDFRNRQTFMDALNSAERRHDAQMARSLRLALPIELSLDAQVRIAKEFLEENFVAYGYCVDSRWQTGCWQETPQHSFPWHTTGQSPPPCSDSSSESRWTRLPEDKTRKPHEGSPQTTKRMA